MSRRLAVNLLLALAVATLALVLFLKPEQPGPQPYALSTLTPQAVTMIELVPRQGPALKLERQAGRWRLTQPFPARADPNRVDALLSLLAARSEQRLPAEALEKFGLAPPFLRLTVRTPASEQVFAFGDRQPVSSQIYVLTAGSVYLVSPVYLMDVSRGAVDFVAKNPLAEGETPVGFELPGLTLELENGRWQRKPDDGRLSADQLNRFADEWRLASAASVERAGDAPALARITLRLSDGRVVPFSLVAREPEWILRREDEGLEYHFPPEVGARLLKPGRGDTSP